MNPWITGQLIEAMQREARNHGDQARMGRHATIARHERQTETREHPTETRRARVGFAIARLGLRIARNDGDPATWMLSSRSRPLRAPGGSVHPHIGMER